MSELTKISVANGKVLAHTKDGNVRLASEGEVATHFASQLPQTYKNTDSKLVEAAYQEGFVYGKYANNKVLRKQVVAIAPANQTESIDTVQKNVKVPRNESKAKPTIDVDDKSVKNPTKIRTKDYKRGKGGEDLNDVPRAKDDGVGGKKVTFEEENANKATSNKPDTYVQKLNKNVEPTKAGNEKNHTASSEIQIVSNGSMYQNLKLSKKDEDSCPDCKQKDCVCDKEEDKECCEEDAAETKEATKDETNVVEAMNEKIAKLEDELKEAKQALAKKEVIEKRFKVATKYALAMKELNPTKYASADVIVDLVEKTANTMSRELIENAIENAQELRRQIEAANNQRVITAATYQNEVESDGNLATAIVVQNNTDSDDDK
jgi:hypothetical protein